ncbi:MAG: Gfo/Idh/MocA family oxidoreductase [Armatimonadota bacterium]|nr:Gfo/Idh/MocA family oxidoreductase [Armatimonadota bacterium]
MNKNTPLRIGAVGCGMLSSSMHIPAIMRIPELDLVALCDINPERLQAIASKHGATRTFTDMEEMLDNCELDGVSIVGPPSLHVSGAKLCLQRQIPFMTEKPLTTTLDEARELAELAKKYGDCGMVGFTSRFSPANRLARQISRSPEFGQISYIATTHLTQCSMPKSIWGIEDFAESFVKLHGVHAIDLWRFYGGDPVEVSASIAAFKVAEDGQSANGSILVHVRSEGGPHGTIHMKSGASHNGDINADVMGEWSRVRMENDQTLNYENARGGLRQMMADDILADTLLPDTPVGQFVGTGLQHFSYYPDFFRFEWMAFARSLQRGLPLSPSIQDAYKTTCLMEAICESLHGGGVSCQLSAVS